MRRIVADRDPDRIRGRRRSCAGLSVCAAILSSLAGVPSAGADAATNAIDAMSGARVRGSIPGLSVEVTSAIAYRDWMPGVGGMRGEDGGSALHVVIGLSLSNSGSGSLRVDRAARIAAAGEPLVPIALDDLSGTTVWPWTLAPGEAIALQLGTREGPMLPVATSLALEIDLTDAIGNTLVISFDSLAIGRTD